MYACRNILRFTMFCNIKQSEITFKTIMKLGIGKNEFYSVNTIKNDLGRSWGGWPCIYIYLSLSLSLLCCSFNTWWLIEGGEPYQRCIHVRCILTCFSVSLRCSYVVFFHHISLTCMRVLNRDTWEMTTRWKSARSQSPALYLFWFIFMKDVCSTTRARYQQICFTPWPLSAVSYDMPWSILMFWRNCSNPNAFHLNWTLHFSLSTVSYDMPWSILTNISLLEILI